MKVHTKLIKAFGALLIVALLFAALPVQQVAADASTAGPGMVAAADRLVSLQNTDGGWDWNLDDGNPATGTALNILGPIGKGLAQGYLYTGDPAHLAALEKVGSLLLTKTAFSTSDGYLAAQLDEIFGGTTYRDYLTTNFYSKLAAGTYVGSSGTYDTQTYILAIRNGRTGRSANLAAWDLGLGLVGAASCGVTGTELLYWIDGVKAEINELDDYDDAAATMSYFPMGLAGALYGLAFVGEEMVPTAGYYASATSFAELFEELIALQNGSGGFVWHPDPAFFIEDDQNEGTQATAYAILALNEYDRAGYLTEIIDAADYLLGIQLATGGWDNYPAVRTYPASGENNEVTAEALWGIQAAYDFPLSEAWVCETGVCGHPGAEFSSIQTAIDTVADGATINVYPGTYAEALELRTPKITVQSIAGAATTILDVPFGSLTTGVKVLANMGTVTFDGFTVQNFTEGGIIQGMAAGTGTTFHVLNNIVLPDADYLRNGIQVSGNGSTVKGNYVEGAFLTPDWGSTGILVVNASNVVIENNEVSGDLIGLDMGIGVLNYSVTSMDNIQILNNVIHGVDYSLDVSAANGTISGVVITGNQVTDYIEPLWAGIYGSGVSVAQVDGTENWWGSILGPQGPVTGDVVYSPWCGDAACSFLVYDTPQTNGIYVEGGEVVISGSVSVPGGIIANEPGVKYFITAGTIIENNSPCFVVNANDVQIIGEFPGEQTCIPTGTSAGIEVADGVQGLQVVNLKFEDSVETGAPAINFLGGVDGFQILNNYFDGFATAIAFDGTVTNTYDDYFIQGNMFKGATIVPGTNSINAEYNSWGVNADPGITNVDADPFTHADLSVETVYPLYSGNQIAAGETITYTVMADLTEISGAEFTLTYPTAVLDLTSTTEGTAFVGILNEFEVQQDLLDISVDGEITFRGTLPEGAEPVTGTDVVLFTATFTATTTGTGTLDFVEILQGFSMTPADPYFTNHVYPFAFTPADLAVIDLPTITADGIEGYYLVDETREFTVTLTNPATGGDFEHVLFRFEVTAAADPTTLFQYDEGGTWFDMPLDCTTTPGTCVGYYGPLTGFPIDDDYTATSTFQVEFAADGLYPFTITLVDLDAASKVLDTYTNTAVVYTVPTITSMDITGPYQATDPQAFNLTVTVDPDMVGAVVFELEFDFPDGTVISYGGMDYTCTATGCPLIPVTLVGGANPLPFTVTFPAGYIGDVTVSLFDTGWDPDRLLASETFENLIVYGNFAVDGKVMMQGRYSRGGVLMTLTNGVAGYGPYTATSLDKLGPNLAFTDVAEGYYVVTTTQDRYLNLPGAMLVVNNTMTLPDLYLYGGNANGDDAIGIGDASVVGGDYGSQTSSAGDVNFDNRVNIQDLALVGGNYGLTDEIYADWLIPYEVTGVFTNVSNTFSATLTGAYTITINGSYTGQIDANTYTIEATVTGDKAGTLVGTYNMMGQDTLAGTLTTSAGTYYVIGVFPQSGIEGHFIGAVVDFPPAVTSITVAGAGGATSVAVGGTLQMEATVLPATARLTDVIWSVWSSLGGSGTSLARIDPITGELKAYGSGTVTVLAKGLDGSHVYGSAVITIP